MRKPIVLAFVLGLALAACGHTTSSAPQAAG